MGMTTMGVKLDEATRDRIKLAAQHIDRTPHWLIKQAIFNYLEQLEQGAQPVEFPLQAASDNDETLADEPHQPFTDFAEQILPQTVARAAITSRRRPETEAVPMLLEQARLPAPLAEKTHQLARSLADKLRHQREQPDAPAWCKACYRSSHSPRKKAWR